MLNLNSRRQTQELEKQQLRGTSLISFTHPNALITEQFKTIRTNIQFSMIDKGIKTIVFTSSGPFEGKSYVAANTAFVFAKEGKKVLLVDADMRKPTLHKTFLLPNEAGLSTLIASRSTSLKKVVQHHEATNIYVLPSGPIPPNPSELLNTNRMQEIMEELKKEYDFIFFDMPPVVSVTDAQILAGKTDGVIFVIRQNIAHSDEVRKAKELLDVVHANILGVIYNGAEKKSDRSYGYYGYGHKEKKKSFLRD